MSLFCISILSPISKADPIWRTYPVTFGGNTFPLTVYFPDHYSVDRKWPVVLFLHGAMERGTDGLKQTEVGLGTAIRAFPKRFPAIVVFPQIPKSMWWSWSDGGLQFAAHALQLVLKSFSVDRDRIYLTGVSMGGTGAWELAIQYPSLFAAVVPIASAREPDEKLAALTRMPVWAFHGKEDWICPVEATQDSVNFLKKTGNTQVKYTEYPDADHKQAWERAYAEFSFAKWLFEQDRRKPVVTFAQSSSSASSSVEEGYETNENEGSNKVNCEPESETQKNAYQPQKLKGKREHASR